MTRTLGELTTEGMTRLDADAFADKLRERYKDFPHFQARVYVCPIKLSDGPVYIVRSNLVNGLPPTKHARIYAPDAYAVAEEAEQAA